MAEKPIKSKWQELMKAPKGGLEYNPGQSFALQVFWILRSPSAAEEMIEKGFKPCVKATLRDSPSTLCYFFRIARDQRLAAKYKEEVKTIGQHPHYQPSFKSIQMGIPQHIVELKIRNILKIDVSPLSWGEEEPISGHEKELDFDPVLLECTEVYLDNRSFYEHAASNDWMKASAELWKPSSSLKPKTFCLGSPSEDIWERTLESTLKAVRLCDDKNSKILQPGLFFGKFPAHKEKQFELLFFLELDLVIEKGKLESCRSHVFSVQEQLEAPFMIVLPLDMDYDGSTKERELTELRVIWSFPFFTALHSSNLKVLAGECQHVQGQLIVFEKPMNPDREACFNDVHQRIASAQQFLSELGENYSNISIQDGHKLHAENKLAGYPLHPLFQQLVQNPDLDYRL